MAPAGEVAPGTSTTTRYEIRGPDGRLAAVHVRQDGPAGKNMWWEDPSGTMGLGGTPLSALPLYRAEDAAHWSLDLPVIVAEGEKATEALRRLGYQACGTVTGAAATPGIEALIALSGHDVILWPDNDEVGREHMTRVAELLQTIAASTRIVRWAAKAKEGWDAADLKPEAIAKGLEKAELFVMDSDEGLPEISTDPTAPAFAIEHGVHTAWYRQLGIRVEFDLFHNDVRHGELSAEITILRTDLEPPTRIHRSRAQLTSVRSRSELANNLAKLDPEHDWRQLINDACERSIDAYREGIPAILLRDAPIPSGDSWILPPLVLTRHPTILFGDGATGKSLLALACGLSIHTGRADLLGIEPTSRLKVAYLDWEFDAWEHRQRMESLLGAEPPPDIVYQECAGPLHEQVDRVRRVIKEHDVGYLIIDSVGAACGGEPESAEVALRFFEAIRRIGVGALCIAHITKNGKDHYDKPFGSVFFSNMARSIWLARKQQELSATSFRVGLYNKKANSGPLSQPISYEISFGERTTLKRISIFASNELASHMSATSRIKEALRSGSKSYQELADLLDLSVDIVRARVQGGYGSLFTRWTEEGTTMVGLLAKATEEEA